MGEAGAGLFYPDSADEEGREVSVVAHAEHLAAFIVACYDEAGSIAKAAQNRFPGPWDKADNADSPLPAAVTLYDRSDESVGVIRGSYAAAHIAACDPAHRLADIALKRAILAEHAPIESIYGPACGTCVTWQDAPLAEGGEPEFGIAIPQAYPCTIVRQLGSEFAAKPGYRVEWKS